LAQVGSSATEFPFSCDTVLDVLSDRIFMASMSMRWQQIPVFLSLLCCMAYAMVDGNIETCASGSKTGCAASERRAENVVYADYGPSVDEDEQEEDVNDADSVMHMQMRVNIDVPTDSKAPKGGANPQVVAGVAAQVAAQITEELQKNAQAASSGAAAIPLVAAAAAPVAGLQKSTADQSPPQPVAPAAKSAASTGVAAATGPSSHIATAADPISAQGSYIVLGAGIGAAFMILGAVLVTLLRPKMAEREAKKQTEMRVAGKAWMLEWALGFDPADETDDEEMVKVTEAEQKLPIKKKQPPMPCDSDGSADTDCDEPEAESELGAYLEDALYVAEQVEVGNSKVNEVADRGYGMMDKADVRLADQIRCDLR